MAYTSIGIVAGTTKEAREGRDALKRRYKLKVLDADNPPACGEVDALVALGGDGFMLHTLHAFRGCNVPIYGMNCGTVGFLLNEYVQEDLLTRINSATKTVIHPLRMTALDADGAEHSFIAYNEVSLLRQSNQAARLRISLDGTVHMKNMICDGVLVSTPAGSSAYNVSAGGPILPLSANLLALTPISPFRPRQWRGALLPQNVSVEFDVLTPTKRPVNAVADFHEVKNVVKVEVHEARREQAVLLFDPGHSLEERIVREQFTP